MIIAKHIAYSIVNNPTTENIEQYYEVYSSNYYIYFNNNYYYFTGCISNTPNGTGTRYDDDMKAIKTLFTNQIKIQNKVTPVNFTFNQITQCSSYYKSIFNEGDWNKYFDIDNLSNSNKYLEIKR